MRLSASVRTRSRFGAPSTLKSATTAIGSVGAINAEKTIAVDHPTAAERAPVRVAPNSRQVVAAVAARTPGTASAKIVRPLARSSEKRRW